MSLNIKLMPLLFVPLIFFFLANAKQRIEYSIASAATVFCAGLPYLLQDPVYIAHRVLGYNGAYGVWGFSCLLRLFSPELDGINTLFQQQGKTLLFAIVLLYSVWINRLRNKPGLMRQSALLMLLFFTVTPGFGLQYLVWLAPLVLPLEIVAIVSLYATATLLLSVRYQILWAWSSFHTLPSVLLNQLYISSGIVRWLVIAICFLRETWNVTRENRIALQ